MRVLRVLLAFENVRRRRAILLAVALPDQPINGTYSVNSDCTGTTSMTIAGIDSSWHFVILQGAEQIIFIATPSGYVWAGTLSLE